MTRIEFEKLDSLVVVSSDSSKDYKVLKYSCGTVPTIGSPEFFEGSGYKISEELRKSVNKIEPGGIVLFDSITIINSFGETKRAGPIVLRIK